MIVPVWVWVVTLGATLALLVLDVFVIGRNPHEPSMKETGIALAFYIGAAVVFGVGVTFLAGGTYGGQFFAGWITEYSLSIDNLFVFIIIMSRFAVPRSLQQTALLVGIILALVLRGLFIGAGAVAIQRLSWIFYVFGAFLVYTAVGLARQNGDDDYHENRLIGFLRAHLRVAEDYDGVRLTTHQGGRRFATPMLVVLVALGTTDLLFALDSIPAIYGLTKEPYLVLTANIFALMGLRQLYFLIGGLLKRLVYLSLGLSVVLAFIGIKLVLEALHLNSLPFVNGGEHVSWAPEIPIWLSLVIILGTLVVTTVASLLKVRRDPAAAGRIGAEPAGGDPESVEPTGGETVRRS